MKRYLILIIPFAFLIGCINHERTPKRTKYGINWELDNLFGKVKTLEQFRANVINFETNQTEEPIINFRKKYSETGLLVYHETFSNFGELEQRLDNEFDKYGNRVKSNSVNYLMPFKSTETAEYDDEGRLIYAKVVFDDTLHAAGTYKYDHLNNIIAHKSIQNSDTTFVYFEYEYNEQDQMIWRKQIEESDGRTYEYITEFRYDNTGNNIELFNVSEILGELKLQHEYNSENKLIKTKEYQDGHITKETKFDTYNNPVSVKHFSRGEFVRELKHEYSFDKVGNWIEKRTFLNENEEPESGFKLVFIETRKIEYYK